MKTFSFSKSERLKHKKQIEALFACGQSKVFYPLLFYWKKSHSASTLTTCFAVSVPKKRFKSAVIRNKVKRRIKESYRLSKPEFYAQITFKGRLDLMCIYVADSVLDYKIIEKAMHKGLEYLTDPKNDQA